MTTKSATTTLDDMAQDDRFLGFGYIGERRNLREAVASGEWGAEMLTLLDEADAMVLATGVRGDKLFDWANSKNGRWFADCMFGGSPEHAAKFLPR